MGTLDDFAFTKGLVIEPVPSAVKREPEVRTVIPPAEKPAEQTQVRRGHRSQEKVSEPEPAAVKDGE